MVGRFLPLTCRGPAAEVRSRSWCHGCSRPSRCSSSPWWLDPAPWCSPNARCHPRTGGRQRGPPTGWSGARCKTHLSRNGKEMPQVERMMMSKNCIKANYGHIPLPGKMLDRFLSTALFLSSPPFRGVSARIIKKNGRTKIWRQLYHFPLHQLPHWTTRRTQSGNEDTSTQEEVFSGIFDPAVILPTRPSPALCLFLITVMVLHNACNLKRFLYVFGYDESEVTATFRVRNRHPFIISLNSEAKGAS